jgi:hypothetical protein
MTGTDAALISWLALAAVVLLVILAICWIILPFAIIGTKPLLRELISELKRQNALLEQRLPALRPPQK